MNICFHCKKPASYSQLWQSTRFLSVLFIPCKQNSYLAFSHKIMIQHSLLFTLIQAKFVFYRPKICNRNTVGYWIYHQTIKEYISYTTKIKCKTILWGLPWTKSTVWDVSETHNFLELTISQPSIHVSSLWLPLLQDENNSMSTKVELWQKPLLCCHDSLVVSVSA
jgi:hypothetical protein